MTEQICPKKPASESCWAVMLQVGQLCCSVTAVLQTSAESQKCHKWPRAALCHMSKRLPPQCHVSALQVFPTYLVAGLGMVAAGLVLNQVE